MNYKLMRTHQRHLLRSAVLIGLMGAAPALATADELHLRHRSLPVAMTHESGKVDIVLEASAVQPIGDGHRLLVAHDKHPALYVVDTATGRILGAPITSPSFPEKSKLGGPKWEGMAHDSEGNFYIIGAHVGKSDAERASKSVLLRFRLHDSEQPAIDDDSVVRFDISRSLASVLKAEGLDQTLVNKRKIEGLAIRETKQDDGSTRRELVIGLRAPHDKVRAFGADITHAKAGAELELKPVFSFKAEPREGVISELTAMEYIPALHGFLVNTASEDDNNAYHGNTLWFIADGQTAHPRKIAVVEVAMKLEGLTYTNVEKNGSRTSVKLVMTYDNDPHTTKIPSRLQSATLVIRED